MLPAAAFSTPLGGSTQAIGTGFGQSLVPGSLPQSKESSKDTTSQEPEAKHPVMILQEYASKKHFPIDWEVSDKPMADG